jgi:hypothetical protein
MNSLPKCSRYGEAEPQGEGVKAGSFEMPRLPRCADPMPGGYVVRDANGQALASVESNAVH